MGTYGDPITQGSIPIVGTVGTDYAVDIDLFLTEVKARLESKVPLTSIAAGTLDLSNNPINNASWIALYDQQVTPTAPIGSLQKYGGELWFVSNAGAVQLTSGGHVNSAATGGITGDYGSGPEQFRYVSATSEYTAYSNFAGGVYGLVWALNFDIAAASTGSIRVRLAATGVGSSYTLILPAALPGAQSLLQLSPGGTMLASNTVPGAVTVNSTITATSNVTAPDFRYTADQTCTIPACAAVSPTGTAITGPTSGGVLGYLLSAGHNTTFPIPIPVGSRLTGYKVHGNKLSTSGAYSAQLIYSINGAEGLQGAGTSTSASNPGDISSIITEVGLSVGVAAGGCLYLVVKGSNTGGADAVYQIEVYINRA